MDEMFKESERLREIIERQGWSLYDTTQTLNRRKAFTWEELESKGPAKIFEIDHDYLFAPTPKYGLSLRQAYTPTKGLGPSILVESPNDERWKGLYLIQGNYERGKPILFSRLDFQKNFLGVFSPRTSFMLDSDKIAISYPWVIDTFKKFFRIVSPSEYSLVEPIPMPFEIQNN